MQEPNASRKIVDKSLIEVCNYTREEFIISKDSEILLSIFFIWDVAVSIVCLFLAFSVSDSYSWSSLPSFVVSLKICLNSFSESTLMPLRTETTRPTSLCIDDIKCLLSVKACLHLNWIGTGFEPVCKPNWSIYIQFSFNLYLMHIDHVHTTKHRSSFAPIIAD